MSRLNKVLFPNLDGLRFLAFMAVFVNHAVVSLGYRNTLPHYSFVTENFLMNGDLGVNFFFVLSGFLITYLLLKEKEVTGSINIKHFYLRRILRIWPLYFFIVFICLVVIPLFIKEVPAGFPINIRTDQLNPWFYYTFTVNFDYLFNGISNVLIGVLWSVSIEEQFYLFWPLIIFLVPKKYFSKVFITIILGSIAFRLFYAHGNVMIIRFHSLSSISDLSTGALIAYLATEEKFIERIKCIPKSIIIGIYCFGFMLFPFREYIWKLGSYYSLAASIVPVIFSVFFAFVILEQNYAEHSFYKIGKSKLISSFGKYTYGMYCYHMIVFCSVLYSVHLIGIDITRIDKYTFMAIVCASLIITIAISKISYLYFELKFLKLKNRFSVIVKD